MKIKSLQISNVLSFKYVEDIAHAEKLTFDEGLNIVIGENGAGKSTALEVINFLFKRVIYKQYNFNQELFLKRNSITLNEKKQTIQAANSNSFGGFRLNPNWNTESKPQIIRVEIDLDEIDLKNIQLIKDNFNELTNSVRLYAAQTISNLIEIRGSYTLDVILEKSNQTFRIAFQNGGTHDFGFDYLTNYNFYKEAISIYNYEHPSTPITPLHESFALIGSYRNYHAFTQSISLREQHPSQQIQNIKSQNYSKSLNTSDNNEPSIFALVRLRVAAKHFGLISQKLSESECEEEANKSDFVQSINKKLKIVNLECRIRLVDLRSWQYGFEFYDIRRNRPLNDINSLSAGQKAIIHLVFEAYGQGDIKGGVIIIDEPEIHLHYQFQNEYLQVVRDLNREQGCQYILVTHSEALINSSTIGYVKRFALCADGYTKIKAPLLSTSQKMLIKILDNTRSTYAFFAKKVLLVEGDTDRYLFKSIIQECYPELDQEIAVLYIGGKCNYEEWSNLFKSFGLFVFCIADFDFIAESFYPAERGKSIKTSAEITAFKSRNPDWETKIEEGNTRGIYILKNGDLEHYLSIPKGLDHTIEFCNSKLNTFLADNTNSNSIEIREIFKQITS